MSPFTCSISGRLRDGPGNKKDLSRAMVLKDIRVKNLYTSQDGKAMAQDIENLYNWLVIVS